jgi:hypothetical protein
MPYDQTILTEARYVQTLGYDAREHSFHATYNGVLMHWFPTSRGFILDHQVSGEGRYIVVRHAGGYRNPLLIVKLERPSKWTPAGRDGVISGLERYIEGRFELTKYDTIYGLAGIGLHWMVCRMDKSGSPNATVVLDWQENITSGPSYTQFQTIAEHVYELVL